MRPDGEGTDERIKQGSHMQDSHMQRSRWGRSRSANSLERDIIILAVAFAVLAVIGWGAVFLSKRAHEPAPGGDNQPALQQSP